MEVGVWGGGGGGLLSMNKTAKDNKLGPNPAASRATDGKRHQRNTNNKSL